MKKQPPQNLRFNLPVSIFSQGNVFVAYTPALDFSTYGNSKLEAQKNFEEIVNTFFASFDDHRELGQVLDSLGWTKQKNHVATP